MEDSILRDALKEQLIDDRHPQDLFSDDGMDERELKSPLQEYKTFIDELVVLVNTLSRTAGQIKRGATIYRGQTTAEQDRQDKAMASLSAVQREVIFDFLMNEPVDVVGQVLSHFSWKDYRISRGDAPLAVQPFCANLSGC
ncbi:DUF6547 family protein [Tengunoibacter tsumagoiensis]|uniref:Uncharacterized protein n=1 Tax=Tengunoibacter tsumagoiensis TaxID=2014871 RepID=A0A402A3K3_9CHLR|nr:DUF6547 family protein [Tengunoibacter tsumagoiensis]GCE13571.1 hypothetical protein KTT_34300 [Tengunoibacter tsumagoiensis]